MKNRKFKGMPNETKMKFRLNDDKSILVQLEKLQQTNDILEKENSGFIFEIEILKQKVAYYESELEKSQKNINLKDKWIKEIQILLKKVKLDSTNTLRLKNQYKEIIEQY